MFSEEIVPGFLLSLDFRLTAEERQKEIKALTASFKQQASQIQKLSAQLATVSPRRATQVVDNNQ
jgi:hypothetical protein